MPTPQKTRRVEAKNLPVDVYNAMRTILRHTGESQSSFINRAIRAEVEKRGFEIQMQIASRDTMKAREERIKKLSRKLGSREAKRRVDTQISNEINNQIKIASRRNEHAKPDQSLHSE